MAEQYQSFQGREPTIDVDLFIKKAAQEETVRAAKTAELQRGMQLGIQAYDAYTSGELKQAQTGLAEAQTAATEQKTAGGGADPQEVLKNQEAQKKIDAGKVISEFGGMLDSALGGNQLDVNSAAASSAFLQAGMQRPDEAMAQLEKASQLGLLDPQITKSVGQQLLAVKKAEQAMALEQAKAVQAQQADAKMQDSVLQATGILAPQITKIPGAKPSDYGFTPRSRLHKIGDDNRVVIGKDGRYEKAADKGEPKDDNVMYYKKDGTIVGMGLPDDRRKDLETLQSHQALNPKLYGPTTVGGMTEADLAQKQPVDTSNNTAMGLAARSATAVDTGPVTANTIEGRAQAAIKAADAGINKLLSESPTNSAKEAILRGKKLGQDIANKARNTAASFQPTTVPLPQNTAYITRASFNPGEVMKSNVGSIQYAKDHLASIIPGADVEVNLPEKYITRKGTADSVVIEPKIIERIKNDPLYKGLPAKVLGMIAIESGGNPAAYNKGTGAAGAMQLLPGAAIDGGIDPSLETRLNPEENIKGGTAYLQRIGADIAATYTKKVKELQQNSLALGAFASRNGHIQKLDPRVELLAYNGGASYVKAAIRAGKLSWEEIEQHIRDVKHTAAEEENIGYANKVIAASLFFIEGGNTSDEAYVNELRHSGIITVNPKKPAGTYV